jgi:hypothetical protein
MRSVLGTHYLSSYVGERGMEHNISQFNPLKCHHSSCKSKHGSPKIRQRRPVQWTVEEADTTRGGTDTWQRIRCSISALLNLQLSATQPKKGIGEGQICSSCNDGCLKLSFSLSLSLSLSKRCLSYHSLFAPRLNACGIRIIISLLLIRWHKF